MTSARRISHVSTQPPRAPARPPIVSPSATAPSTAMKATPSDARAPKIEPCEHVAPGAVRAREEQRRRRDLRSRVNQPAA